jgi:hypothetical protein
MPVVAASYKSEVHLKERPQLFVTVILALIVAPKIERHAGKGRMDRPNALDESRLRLLHCHSTINDALL